MRIYMPRFHVGPVADNLWRLEKELERASSQRCALALFPELFLTGYSAALEAPDARASFVRLSSCYPEMLIAFGTVSEGGYNRLPVYLGGTELAHYDKVHLFRPNGEHLIWQPGETYVVLNALGWKIGLLTCNDIRFAEQARAMALQGGVELLLCPAYWPWQRNHIWKALLRARSIENCCYAAGCCVASVDFGEERTDGAGNYVFDPLGNQILPKGSVYELDRKTLGDLLVDTRAECRRELPVRLIAGPDCRAV